MAPNALSARTAILGLSTHSDKGHIACAAYESIVYQVRDALDAMRAEAGVDLREVAADGGPTVSKFLMQFTADMTGVDLRASRAAECSALGAVMAGRVAAEGSSAFVKNAEMSAEPVRYRPNLDLGEVERLVSGWHRAVEQVLSRHKSSQN